MPAPVPTAAVAALVAVVLAGGGCGVRDPDRLADLLEVVPASAAQRGLFYSNLRADASFGSVLPLRMSGEVLGVDPEGVDAMLETGGAPLTVLSGRVRPDRVVETVQRHGYVVAERDGWTLFERAQDSEASGPLVAAVPAGAVRRGLLVLGDPDDVGAAVAGEEPVAGAAGVEALLRSMAAVEAATLLLSPAGLIDAARAEGGVEAALPRGRARGELPGWDAAALTWSGDGDAGAVLLALPPGVDGHEAARALVLRAATTPLLGEGRRRTSDLFEGQAPRWDPELGTVRLPVRWAEPDPGAIRPDVERGTLLFLAPSP